HRRSVARTRTAMPAPSRREQTTQRSQPEKTSLAAKRSADFLTVTKGLKQKGTPERDAGHLESTVIGTRKRHVRKRLRRGDAPARGFPDAWLTWKSVRKSLQAAATLCAESKRCPLQKRSNPADGSCR